MTNTITIQTWNMWFGGARVQEGHRKLVEFAQTHPFDVCLVQECLYELAGDVSRALGKQHYQQDFDTAIISSLPMEPIQTDTNPYATAAWVPVGEQRMLVWTVHLHFADYGPYGALKGIPHKEVLAAEHERSRLTQITKVLELTDELVGNDKDIPVVIAGDFNCPATFDWDVRSDRPSVNWPATDAVLAHGFIDAFRAAYPDPMTAPGETWSHIEPLDKEPRDRIDFIFVRGATPIAAKMCGGTPEPIEDESFEQYPGLCRHIPEHQENVYPSDHMMIQAELEF